MKKIIATDKAPAALGPYSQAVKTGNLLFISGQLGIDPATSKLVPGGTAAEAKQAMNNLMNVLKAADGGPSDLVKTTILLNDMDDFGAVNAVYAEFFDKDYPARACFQVAKLPAGGMVEIEAVAEIQ